MVIRAQRMVIRAQRRGGVAGAGGPVQGMVHLLIFASYLFVTIVP